MPEAMIKVAAYGSAAPAIGRACAEAQVPARIISSPEELAGEQLLIFAPALSDPSEASLQKIASLPKPPLLLIDTAESEKHVGQAIKAGLPPQRVMGVGTVYLSHLFRQNIAARLKVSPQEVHAFIAGIAGVYPIPLWSLASVAGIPLHHWAVPGHGKLSVRDRTEIFQSTRQSPPDTQGISAVQIIEALNNSGRILSIASAVNGPPLSRPTLLSANGIDVVIPLPLNPAEQSAFDNAATMLA